MTTGQPTRLSPLFGYFADNPARSVMAAFAGVILLGTALLMLPIATEAGSSGHFVTALFTATSATCVTGLVVVDTPTHWSLFGELVILGLIQVGGFGVMTLTTMLVLLIGRKIGVQASMLAAAESRTVGNENLRRVLLGILRITLVVELGTAAILALRFWWGYHMSVPQALYWGIFHGVSAFNNAGFGLASTNMMPFNTDPIICLPIMLAVMTGGIGFPVLWELRAHFFAIGKWSVHMLITVGMSIVLWIAGTVTFGVFEWRNPDSMGALPAWAKVMNAAFMSVSARTAGFNSVDLGNLHPETLLSYDVLQFIGAGSAGTAGGIKVGTFALLAFVIWAEVRGEPTVHVFHRRLVPAVQRQALTVALLAVGAVGIATALLMVLTPHGLDRILFEVTSAFGTVGLSTNLTPTLPASAQLVLVALMYFGRVGPQVLGAALALRNRPRQYELPEERVLIG
ncbi:TrkH family potassium uptake protein [Kribbia dieselivorans]|uniref:TrkH family potassium uptake protein n=1 Tax=Kribbia dieselivorans TaxID=331526 RepID=UPI000AE4508B|nr:potassium transporter TrkG [Kribbia dieselivorans]